MLSNTNVVETRKDVSPNQSCVLKGEAGLGDSLRILNL